jgi:hypothetical protein
MCHPIPASPSNRVEIVVQVSIPTSATKIKSLADGRIHRSQAGGTSAAVLREPIAIGLNLIEEGPFTANMDESVFL